ncbi:MAG: thioredoxin family protein [Tannerella sp.]|jgi:hypothetical protein|nr:thioredoxin family protein [Tannerella sp.]
MKTKVYTIAIIIAATGMLLSAGSKTTSVTTGYRTGEKAPEIKIEGGTTLAFANNAGRYTLVNFWAAYNADSRVRNIRMSNKINEIGAWRIRFCSISLDERRSVYEETLKSDNINIGSQLYDPRGTTSPLYELYNLRNGFKNYLIDDKGVIIASDVQPDELAKLLR